MYAGKSFLLLGEKSFGEKIYARENLFDVSLEEGGGRTEGEGGFRRGRKKVYQGRKSIRGNLSKRNVEIRFD